MAAEEDQGLTGKQVRGLDFPQKNCVVASNVRGYDAANDLGDGVFEEGDPGWRPAIANAETDFGFGSLLGLREIDGEGLLVLLQNVNAEEPVLF